MYLLYFVLHVSRDMFFKVRVTGNFSENNLFNLLGFL